jgi:glycosyltransferase involved in cell wall biosynthesis
VAPIRIYFNYQVVDAPWGGANSFLSLLSSTVARQPDFELVPRPDQPCDLLFINQLYRGPGRAWWHRKFTTPEELHRLRRTGYRSAIAAAVSYWLKQNRPRPRIVCRLVNLESHAYRKRSARDAALLEALAWTDVDVFQSEYIQQVFRDSGYDKSTAVIIHNGADQRLFRPAERMSWAVARPIRLVSCTFATRQSKRFDLIAAASRLPDVTVSHIGAWRPGVDSEQVRLIGQLTKPEMAAFYQDHADAFLHPAERDICPNAVLEAMSCGLPVIYHPVGGTAELVGAAGVALEEKEDVAAAIETLRESYAACRERVLRARPQLSAEFATSRYLEVFRSTVGAA